MMSVIIVQTVARILVWEVLPLLSLSLPLFRSPPLSVSPNPAGECCELPSRVRGRAVVANAFWDILRPGDVSGGNVFVPLVGTKL